MSCRNSMISRYHLINLTRIIKVCNDKNVVMEATTITERKINELQVTTVAR